MQAPRRRNEYASYLELVMRDARKAAREAVVHFNEVTGSNVPILIPPPDAPMGMQTVFSGPGPKPGSLGSGEARKP